MLAADLMAKHRTNARYQIKTNLPHVGHALYANALYTGHYIPSAGRTQQATVSATF